MTMRKMAGWCAVALLSALAPGCGSSGSSNAAPNADQKAVAQQADAASSTMEQTANASNDAIVESGAPGATSAKAGESQSSTSGMTINFQVTVNLTVDLDALNSSGQDAYPNASGKFSVSATGTITGDASAGEATYAVQITWLTAGVFTDPVCGDTATVASGSNWSYSLVVQWSRTDDLNWAVQATADVNGTLNATVTNPNTWTVTGTVTRHASASFTRTAGTYGYTFGISGQRTVVVTDGTDTHTVVTTISALDHILIDVDGVVFGPYTLAQILWWWGFNCNG